MCDSPYAYDTTAKKLHVLLYRRTDEEDVVDERRRKTRSAHALHADLRMWRSLRTSWRNIERSAAQLGDEERAQLARQEFARAQGAIARIEAEVAARSVAESARHDSYSQTA
jgi:hypothetical protein